MSFITDLFVLTNEKGNSSDSILGFVNQLKKNIYYKLIKIFFNVFGLWRGNNKRGSLISRLF